MRDPYSNPEESPWVFPVVWSAILLGSLAATYYSSRQEPVVLAPRRTPPPPEPEPLPPPSEYEAAVTVALSSPDGDPQILATQAYALSHPECPSTPQAGGADCMAAYVRVKGYIDDLLTPPPPVVPEPLPNQCDPLQVPAPGLVCVDSGGVWVLRPEQKILEDSFLEGVQSNEVRFSSDYEIGGAGPLWPIQTLDVWMEQQRQLGRLGTWGSEEDDGWLRAGLPMFQWAALGWPGAENTYNILYGHRPYLNPSRVLDEATAARAIREFAESHFVVTPNGTVRIIDLPHTQAVEQLRTAIVSYVAGFQNRTFPRTEP